MNDASANRAPAAAVAPSASAPARDHFAWPLLLLLLVGAVARVWLTISGGRFFIADEGRYLHGVRLYYFLIDGDWQNAAVALRHADNWGFIPLAALITAVQHVFGIFGGHAIWPVDFSRLQQTLAVGASVLSLAPVVAVGIVYRLTQRLGFTSREAFSAALILSFSNTAFYFSRHLFPYDASIAIMFGAFLVAAGAPGIVRSLIAGAMAGAAFHVYNGYWYLIPFVGAMRLMTPQQPTRKNWGGLMAVFSGAAVAVVLPYVAGRCVYGPEFLTATLLYGRSVVQGLYREGWSLPAEYLWHSEGCFGLVALALPLAVWLKRGTHAVPGNVRYVAFATVGIWLIWTGVSTVGQVFVLNARTVKPLVPLLAILGGWGLASLAGANRRAGGMAAALLVALGLMNLLPHYWQVFPREFEAAARSQVGHPKRAASLSGTFFEPAKFSVTVPDYAMVNAQYLYPVRASAGLPAGETVFSAAHPLAYKPYQYDGFTPRQRKILRNSDLRMRLIRLSDPAAVPDMPPAEFQSRNGDWPDGFDSEAEQEKTSAP